jgi:hypothetical protein
MTFYVNQAPVFWQVGNDRLNAAIPSQVFGETGEGSFISAGHQEAGRRRQGAQMPRQCRWWRR